MEKNKIYIEDIIEQRAVQFGTSGVRGLVTDMNDEVCYAYTAAFIQYMEETGELDSGDVIAIGGDLRPSTDSITGAVVKAITDRGYVPLNCGSIPTPALANYGLVKEVPTVMVTGSHIPVERNGIKYTKKNGEILKDDEAGIRRQRVVLPKGLFDTRGMLPEITEPLAGDDEAADLYAERYIRFFQKNCFVGKRLGVYQHSAVGRDLMAAIYSRLGADVELLGFSDTFIPVDTEAMRQEDMELARRWSSEYHFDAIVSTDGDGDRPLISDENGKWLRGDIAGILCAGYLDADAVVAPVSCNTALERSGLFHHVFRTRIGSPYVIEGMRHARETGARLVVGYEANGGFLLGSDFNDGEKILQALPTRDAIILHIAILLLSIEKSKTISELVAELPERYTYSNRLKEFTGEKSAEIIAECSTGDEATDRETVEQIFGRHFGKVLDLDTTDGLRITFDTDEIVHLRPSGNAPEFRCYTEAAEEKRAETMNNICMDIMETWR